VCNRQGIQQEIHQDGLQGFQQGIHCERLRVQACC